MWTHDQVEAMTLASQVAIMKDGIIQQVAHPLDLYNTPANKFVAGFIGSPPMNFMTVKVKAENNGVQVMMGQNGNSGVLTALNGMKDKLAAYNGKEIVMGVRPEDIYDKIYYQGDGTGRSISTKVDLVEPMGAEKYLYLSTEGSNVVARVHPNNEAHVNQQIDVVFNMEKVKFFDVQTEKVIV